MCPLASWQKPIQATRATWGGPIERRLVVATFPCVALGLQAQLKCGRAQTLVLEEQSAPASGLFSLAVSQLTRSVNAVALMLDRPPFDLVRIPSVAVFHGVNANTGGCCFIVQRC